MEDEEDDMHICLVCQATVIGLINYVKHKKHECPMLKGVEKESPTTKSGHSVSQETFSQGDTTAQSVMQLLSPGISYSQSSIFSSQMDSPSHFYTSQQSPLHGSNQMFAMITSPSHGVHLATQISFSEDIGPVMSLRQSSDISTASTHTPDNDSISTTSCKTLQNENIVLTTSSEQTSQALALDVNEQFLTLPSERFSPSGNAVNPNMVMSSRSDFFSSLALQKKNENEGQNQNENKDNLTADLPISNILNNLDLYDEDLDFVFSDDDFLQDAFTDESDDDSVPPPNHTHGKWKPGEGPSHHSKVVWQPGRRPMHPSKGKWRPGEMPVRGKLQSHILAREKEKKEKEDTKVKSKLTRKKKEEYICQYCDVKFSNRYQYSSHCMQPEHKKNVANYRKIKNVGQSIEEHVPEKRVKISKRSTLDPKAEILDKSENLQEFNESDSKTETEDIQKDLESEQVQKQEKPQYICAICDKKFINKYIMARHLLSTYHINRTKGHPDAIKVLEQYHKYIVWLSPYQCTICQYYFNKHQDFISHLKSNDHQMKCECLDGEIMCSACKYCCHDNGSLLRHIENDSSHKIAVMKRNKPCIIKEKNYDAECKFCRKVLHSKLHMKRHMRAQHFKEYEEFESTCKLCNKTFFGTYAYNRHMITAQHKLRAEQKKKYGVVDSEDDPEIFNEGIVRTRVNRKVDKPYTLAKKCSKKQKLYKCDFCDFVASQYDELRPHYLECHANHVFVCELCDLTFISEKARKVHFSGIKHQTNLKKSEGKTTANIEQCDYCDRRFEDEKLKQFHTEVYHLHPNSEESLREKLGHEDVTTVKYKEFLSTIDSLSDERVQCLECPKTIMKDYILEHLRSHSGDKPYKCRYCSSGFAAPLSLRRHLMSHVGLADRKCEICGKEFKKFGSYREHMTKHGLEENQASKIVCEICGLAFALQKQLNSHMRRHGEKKFKCEYEGCRWSFFLYNELKAHYRSHTGEKTYLCDICGYAAGTKNRLDRHHHTHTGERAFHCDYCSYKAGTRTHLRRHMRIHIGSKPYKCPYCPYSCNTHENIRKHISKTKKHAGLPIYPCQFCNYGTNNTIDFRFHLEQNHKGEYNFKASDGLALVAGLYKREHDPDKPLEGTEIHQVRERKMRTERQKKQNPATSDYDTSKSPRPDIIGVEKKMIMYTFGEDYEGHEQKIEIEGEYRENCEDFATTTDVVDVHVTQNGWPSFSTQAKIVPITENIQVYQNPEDVTYSGQIASVGYFMSTTNPVDTLTVESSMIPQPPALQVDVVDNSLKWQ